MNHIEIQPPGIDRINGPLIEQQNLLAESQMVSTADDVQHQVDAANAAHSAVMEKLRVKQIEAVRLQQPLGDLIAHYNAYKATTARGEHNLGVYESMDAEFKEKFDSALNHDDVLVGTHIYQIGKVAPGLIHAERHVAEAKRWLASRVAPLAELESRIKACLDDGRQHLSHLLPEDLKHLATA